MTFERLQAASNSLPWQALFYINDCQTQLDLGSNDGRTLRGLETPHVTCVELFKPSVRALKQAGFDEVLCEHIQEAVNRFVQEGRQFERVSCFDVIEHLPKADGEKLLDGIEQIAGREIVLFIPIETPEMHADLAFQAHREFGLSQHPAGQRQLQAHLSFWTPDDLAKRGYVIFEMVNFHGEGQNAFFAAKYANDGDANVAMKRVRAHVDGAHIDRPLMLAGPQHMQFGKAVSIGYGARLECITNYQGTGYTPKLSVGDGTTAEMFLHIGCADRVSIGRDVMIGGHVTIVDHDHGTADLTRPPRYQPLVTAPVVIENGAWIGEYAFIGKGVHVGRRAVIGAGSVLTRDIPAYATAVGMPARVIRRREPLTSIIIPALGVSERLRKCLASIKAHTPEDHEVIVVLNGGERDGLDQDVMCLRNETNLGFAHACNQGMRAATGDYVCLLNDDTRVEAGWLSTMIDVLRYDVGLVGPMTNYASGPQRGDARPGVEYVSRLVGFCLLMRRSLVDEVGYLDEQFCNFEDDDYGLRVRQRGYKLAIACSAFVWHEGHTTFRELGIDLGATLAENRAKFEAKWRPQIGAD